jgi:hypothetical protein
MNVCVGLDVEMIFDLLIFWRDRRTNKYDLLLNSIFTV